MIKPDFILAGVIVITIALLLFVNSTNSKKAKIHEAEQKLKEIKDSTKVEKETKPVKPVEDDGNYLHEYFNKVDVKTADEVKIEEVSTDEITKEVKAVGEVKKFNTNLPDYIEEIENTANIVYEMDEAVDETDEFEEDFAIGVDDDDVEFTNALAEEFNNLSPAMKAFILTNVLKNKNEKPDDSNN